MAGGEVVTQCERLLNALREYGSLSSLEITIQLRIVNVTGRISDLRAQGHDVVATRDDEGVYRYHVREPRVVNGGWLANSGTATL